MKTNSDFTHCDVIQLNDEGDLDEDCCLKWQIALNPGAKCCA